MKSEQLALDPLRETSPEVTLSKLQGILSDIKITRVANITGLDDIAIPVCIAVRPLSKYLSVAQGKGLTHTIAQISAIMESLELFHLENIELPTIHGSFETLSNNHSCLDPLLVNQGFIVNNNIQQTPLHWLRATNLINQKTTWLPRELIAMDMTLPTEVNPYFRQTTTGIAGGNTLEEAIVKALLEVIERQTLILWDQHKEQHTEVIHPEIEDPLIQQTISRITVTGKQIKLFLIHNPWNIPVYFCEIIDNEPVRPVGSCIGSGSHTCHRHAILSAILEAVQTRLTLISGSRDDNYQAFYDNRNKNQPIASDHYPTRRLTTTDLDNHSLHDTSATALNALIQTLQANNIAQILMINHTKPKLKIPIAQIIIPGFSCL